MKKNGQIDESWRKKLNSILGDTNWEAEFYEEDMQTNLWETQEKVRTADTEALKQYIEKIQAQLEDLNSLLERKAEIRNEFEKSITRTESAYIKVYYII